MEDPLNKTPMLRVKVKHLAAEARIIRHEAAKYRGVTRWHLNHHRQTVVRRAARAAHLALGFIRGAFPGGNGAHPQDRAELG